MCQTKPTVTCPNPLTIKILQKANAIAPARARGNLIL